VQHTKLLSFLVLFTITATLSLTPALSTAFAQAPASQGKSEIIGVTGFVPGKNLTVHILVLVHPGENRNEVAAAALAEQGARPFTSQEYSLTGLVWDQFNPGNPTADEVVQYYNPAGDPSENTIGESILLNTHDTWTNVETSIFKFSYGGETNNCPSLVKECQGRQQYDNQNDVAWMELRDRDVLGVTWSGTSSQTGPEADVAMNTKSIVWTTDENSPVYDIETVLLHELGHVAGVGHSDDPNAIMYPSYQKLNRDLDVDDKNAISSLYPLPQVGDSPTVSITSPSDGDNPASGASITFSATASDTEDGTITDITWTSDVTGPITLDGLSQATLSDGSHTITASVTDSDGNSSSDSVTITVGTPVEPPTSDAETANIDYKIRKGPNGGLIITVTLLDGTDAPVIETSVHVEVSLNGNALGDAPGTTNSEGKANFILSNPVKSGIYTTTLLTVDGASWNNDNTNDPTFEK